MKKEYLAPSYGKEEIIDDIVLISVQVEDDTITGIVDIEDLFG